MTGRGSHQPNVPGRGIVAGYGARFWALVCGIGVAAGLAAAAYLELLKAVEHAAWPRDSGSFVHAVDVAAPSRHILVLLAAGAIAGSAMLMLQRLSSSGGGEVSEALWLRDARLPLGSSALRGVVSIVTVGMGASLGREGAPQLAGAAVAGRASERMGVSAWQRRLLVASGAGAGMAAIYNVPLGGALFALEVLLGAVTLPLVLPALATTLVATITAWVAVPDHPTYHAPIFGVSASLVLWAALAGPLAGVAAVGWVRLIARVNRLRPSGSGRVLAPIVVFTALGAVSIAYPQLLGNGLDIVQLSVLGELSFGLLAVLLVLKPLATAACLGSGSPGGLFTPTLAFGVLLGSVLGHLWGLAWPDASPAATR
ncbi:chloride channel protein [Paraconexibacter antarcticus]|uniref:Chloride channel protein n=1 Tax=Paraconexibacter antarcticus TaxID=2949664 RepID=A0ABY5DTH2_9ACTN|nr:chloride channel protein [Paraconexibacter antarcticus]UTI65328.1 chloride channel protein [Paraconexibacter antarcticus]